MNLDAPIIEALEQLPPAIAASSGSVFYTSRHAFTRSSPFYLLGLNPGGDKEKLVFKTVAEQISSWKNERFSWSSYAYQDEPWFDDTDREAPMQRRIRYLSERLGIRLQDLPSSNVIFARSTTGVTLEGSQHELMETCWPVHDAVISQLKCRFIICMGRPASEFVRRKLGADQLVLKFSERNRRRWTGGAYRASSGKMVFHLTHPSVADWIANETDPTGMVVDLSEKTGGVVHI